MEKIYPIAVKRSSPVFPGTFKKEWFDAIEDGKDSVGTAQATDKVFNMLRHKAVIRNAWTEFNRVGNTVNKYILQPIGWITW